MNGQAGGVMEAALSAFGNQMRGLRMGVRGHSDSRKGS